MSIRVPSYVIHKSHEIFLFMIGKKGSKQSEGSRGDHSIGVLKVTKQLHVYQVGHLLTHVSRCFQLSSLISVPLMFPLPWGLRAFAISVPLAWISLSSSPWSCLTLLNSYTPFRAQPQHYLLRTASLITTQPIAHPGKPPLPYMLLAPMILLDDNK